MTGMRVYKVAAALLLAATSAAQQPTVIPPAYFGMTVLDFTRRTPSMTYGTVRSWDAYPHLDWAEANPDAGGYDFIYLDRFIAANAGREMIYTLGRTPRWASSKPNADGPYGPGQCAPPADLKSWDDYLAAIVKHAAGRIRYWELWNEADDPHFYCGDIPTMVKLAEHAAREIKGIDAKAMILSPAATGGPGPDWMKEFLATGGAKYVDVIAFHGYWSAKAEDVLGVVSRYKAAMAAGGAAEKPMWDTESSWSGFGNLGTPMSAAQVAFVARDYLLHWSAGVARFIWYSYDGGAIWGGMWDKVAGESAAVMAYREVYDWMVGATMTDPCAVGKDGVWTCGLSRAGGYRAEAIWKPGGTVELTVPEKFVRYRDLSGGVHEVVGHRVMVGEQPVLLETAR